MEIGTIGAGALARAFAKWALKAGHKVKLSNDSGPDSLREVVSQLGPGAKAVRKEVAASCEMVLLAVPWDNVPGALASLPRWKNQILIDATNPFHGKAGKFTPAHVGNLSTSQFVAALAPGARVVKAFNHMIVSNLEADPVVDGASAQAAGRGVKRRRNSADLAAPGESVVREFLLRRVAFVSADDDGAKKLVEALLETLGYSVIDLGNLRDGGLIQQAGGPLAGHDFLERGKHPA